jgi:hypothetical protein
MGSKRLRALTAALLTAALIVPAVALALTPKRPAAGKWEAIVAVGNLTSPGGGFTVSKDRQSISNLHFDVSSAVASGLRCAAGKISVLGKHRLRLTSRGGVTNWIIGQSTPSTSSGITPINVTVRQAGKNTAGNVYLIFGEGGTEHNEGHLTFGACEFSFGAGK